MSDLEDYFDDEDLYFDDGAADDMAAVADDLAERTMHSPNWIDDPTLETVNYWSDWEYYSDEFFDEAHGREKEVPANSKEGEPTRRTKRKAENDQRPGKRQRLAPLDQFPLLGPDGELNGLELEVSKRPSIVWRSNSTPETPLPETKGVSKSVALLKDWANLPPPTWGLFKGGEAFSEEDTNDITSSLSLKDKKRASAELPQGTDHATQKVLDDSQAASENNEAATTSAARKGGSKESTSNKRKKQILEDPNDDVESKESSKKRRVTNTKKPEETEKGRPIAAPKTTRSGKRRG